MDVIVVQVNVRELLLRKAHPHLFAAVLHTSCELSLRFKTNALFYYSPKPKINEDRFIVSIAPHYVLRFDVHMYDMKVVE